MDAFLLQIDTYLQSSLIASLAAAFLGGLLASLTPCIYPMIPITAGVIGHANVGGSRLRGFLLSLIYVTGMALNDKNEIIAFEFLNLGKFTDAVKAGKTPEEAIAGAMGHYGQWENAAKYIDPRTDEETHSVASVFPVHE